MIEEDFLFRSLSGRTTPEEERAIVAWRAASPDNERQYQALGRVLALTRAARPPADSRPPQVLDVLAEAARRDPDHGRARARWMERWWVRGVGAAALVLMGVAIARLAAPAPPSLRFGVEQLVTGPTETTTIGLSDGTVVRLAPGSQLRFSRSPDSREVRLTGRGFFAVAPLDGLPFRVLTPAGDLTVLGTRFDVESRERDLRLVVLEGRVAVAAPQGGETRVESGQLSRVVDGRLLPPTRTPDLRAETEWVGRFLAFQSTPLRQAAREIEQMYGVEVQIRDAAVADRTVTTWFTDRSLDEVIRIVCAIAVTRCAIEKGVVTIDPA
jgi:ferric-dicitrate binding protein FerR (iron transport regulator)